MIASAPVTILRTAAIASAAASTSRISSGACSAAGAGGQVRLFRVDDDGVQSRVAEFRAPGGGGRLGGVALMPDARTLLLGGRGTITAWDIADPAHPVRRYDFPDVGGDINRLTVSPDGRFVVASVPDRGVEAWVDQGQTWR